MLLKQASFDSAEKPWLLGTGLKKKRWKIKNSKRADTSFSSLPVFLLLPLLAEPNRKSAGKGKKWFVEFQPWHYGDWSWSSLI